MLRQNRAKSLGHSPTHFVVDVLHEIQALVRTIPEGAARVGTSRIESSLELSGSNFWVTPTRQGAAQFGGYALAKDLTLTIGEAHREFVGFARGRNIAPAADWREELRWIWEAVIAGGLTQRHYLDSTGRVIGWATRFKVNGREMVFRNGRRAEKLFGQQRVRVVTYESYF